MTFRDLWALFILLFIAVNSARPLIPCGGRCWWGAWIRPLPPYVRRNGGRRGRIQSPQEVVVEGSADGLEGGAGSRKHRDRTEQKTRATATAQTATATRRKREEREAAKAERREDAGAREERGSGWRGRAVGGEGVRGGGVR